MLAVEKEEAQGEADQQVIAVLEAAATTAAQLEATERSLAQVRGRGRGRGRVRISSRRPSAASPRPEGGLTLTLRP